jgi:hypothetical protein
MKNIYHTAKQEWGNGVKALVSKEEISFHIVELNTYRSVIFLISLMKIGVKPLNFSTSNRKSINLNVGFFIIFFKDKPFIIFLVKLMNNFMSNNHTL